MYQLAPPKTDIMMEHRHLDQRQVCFGANIYINPGEIVFLTADANYTNIYLIDGKKFFLACTLGKVHEN